MGASHGWSELDRARKRDLVDAVCSARATPGPAHVELDLTDRCNAACYFCNQQDLRTRHALPLGRVLSLVDELAASGLQSVRLSGGGDPLCHPGFLTVLDHLASHEIVVDNLTTNGIALGPEVAETLVRHRSREVLCSLNTLDGDDHSRMMGVRPGLHNTVISNLRRLVAMRASSPLPTLTVQFLLDRLNVSRLPEMYYVGRSLRVDRIAVNLVLDTRRGGIDTNLLLLPEHQDAIRSPLAQTLAMDRDAGLLQVCFPFPSWNQLLTEMQAELGVDVACGFTTCPEFSEGNGQCFFSWYHATITGSGDVYPCCLLLNPEFAPLGNILEGSFSDCWHGAVYNRMRAEQREVLLAGGRIAHRPGRFRILTRQCVEPHGCWLKNLFFRGDGAFYRELAPALDQQRQMDTHWLGHAKGIIREAEFRASQNRHLQRAYRGVRRQTVATRAAIRRHLGV